MRNLFLTFLFLLPSFLSAEIAPPDHKWALLQSVFPSGAQRGASVEVQFGLGQGGAEGANAILIDGPPGITARNIEVKGDYVHATLDIAKDAPLGHRMVRVRGGKAGLTNFRWFIVGDLPEYIEEDVKRANNNPASPNIVTAPVIVNGRVQALLDQDCFQFQAEENQTIVAGIASHAIDVMGFDKNTRGFADLSLEILDASGRVLASAGDTIGFDPVIEFIAPKKGNYIARVSCLGYNGFPQAVYRLTLGDVGYVTSIYPGGGKQGDQIPVELSGYNLPANASATIQNPSNHSLTHLATPGSIVTHRATAHWSDSPENLEPEPNNTREQATPLSLGAIANGRFLEPGDEDWYLVNLTKGQPVSFEILAQRYLRSPVDTALEIYDPKGDKLTGNDDGIIFGGETTNDFNAFDSFLTYTPKEDGPHTLRVTENSGTSGPHTVYRLFAHEQRPDFRLFQWPDAVPVWGPGTTGSFLVEVIRLGGLKSTVELSIEGLPEGWTGSTSYSHINDYREPKAALGTKAILTITAPPDAKVGDLAEFHVIGRAETEHGTVEHRANILTLYMYSDPHQFRLSPISRAVVAPSTGPHLSTKITTLTAKPGDELEIPVAYHDSSPKPEESQVILNIGRSHHIANFGAPIKVKPGTKDFNMPLSIPATQKPGIYSLVVSRQWASNYRIGLPGPCTHVIKLEIEKETAAGD